MQARSFHFVVPARIGVALLLLGGLAACDSGKSSKDDGSVVIITPPPPPPPPPLIEDTFGARFGAIFRTSANSDPVDPVQTDINKLVDPTLDPSRLRP